MKRRIINFLKNNGFSKIEKNSYGKDSTNIVFEFEKDENENWIYVADGMGNQKVIMMDSYSLFTLIGLLTFYDVIDKKYKI